MHYAVWGANLDENAGSEFGENQHRVNFQSAQPLHVGQFSVGVNKLVKVEDMVVCKSG
jgi:hypothetical protein